MAEPTPAELSNERLKLIAHDMNNPLTAIRLLAETLRDEINDPQQRQDVMDILEAADLCGAFVEGMGSLIRAPTSDDFTWLPVDLAEVLRASVERPALRRSVRLDLPPELPLHGDRSALKRAFTDLMINARRLVDRNSLVEVFGDDHRSHVEIVLRHAGGSLGPEARRLMFEPFGPVLLRKSRVPVIATGLHFASVVLEHHGATVEWRDRDASASSPASLDLVVRFER